MTYSANIWSIVLLGIAVTYFWRGLGVLLSARIDPNGTLFQWVSCVSYAMLAGLAARMTLLPLGELAETPLIDRLVGMSGAFLVFYLTSRSVLLGVAAGVSILIAATIFRAGTL